MKTNAKLDKWCAEKVGAGKHPKYREYPFTLSDARCREVVRECFEITTLKAIYGGCEDDCRWQAFQASGADMGGFGKTIAEAEIKCLEAIYEQEKEL